MSEQEHRQPLKSPRRDLFAETMLLAREAGATCPQIGESSCGSPVVVDTDDGRVWRLELKEVK